MSSFTLSDDGEHIQQALFRVTGSKTVPQVFIDNDFIGGSDGILNDLAWSFSDGQHIESFCKPVLTYTCPSKEVMLGSNMVTYLTASCCLTTDLVELRENGELKKILYWQSARADATTDSDSW